MTRDEKIQAIQFQDEIGAIVDKYLQASMDLKVMAEVLCYEASYLQTRNEELAP